MVCSPTVLEVVTLMIVQEPTTDAGLSQLSECLRNHCGKEGTL